MCSAEGYIPQYTVEDYRQWQGDWELLRGVPVSMIPGPFGPHQRLAFQLAVAFEKAIQASDCNALVLPGMDWIVSDDTVVRPDISIFYGEVPERHIDSPPTLVCEVLSPSTKSRDEDFKRKLYFENGVGTYLVADPDSKEIWLATYEVTQLTPPGGPLEVLICGDCAIEIECRDL